MVGRPGRNRRLVWRLSLYINALGGTPSPYTGQPLQTYSEELQQQYQRLKETLGPEASRAARIAGRAGIRKHSLAKAASEFTCSGGSAPDDHSLVPRSKNTLFVNAAILDEDGAPSRKPVILNFSK
jgi:hypothetical protein